MRDQFFPQACGLQHGDAGLQKRGAAQVGTCCGGGGDRGFGINADDGEPGGAEGGGGGEARYAAAGDQDVCGDACHGPNVGGKAVQAK